MRTQEVLTYIEKPQDLGIEEAEEIEQLIQRYPWFSAAHVLLAKTHRNLGRHSYKHYLRKASLHAGDRKLLFQLMESDQFVPSNKKEEVADVSVAEQPISEGNVSEETQSNMSVEETVPEVEESVSLEEAKQPSSEKTPTKEEKHDEPEAQVSTSKQPEKTEVGQEMADSNEDAISAFLKSFGGEDKSESQTEESKEKESTEDLVVSDETAEEIELPKIEEPGEMESLEELPEAIEEVENNEVEQEVEDEETKDEVGEEEVSDELDESLEKRSDLESVITYDPIAALGNLSEDEEDVDDQDISKRALNFVPPYNPEKELAKLVEQEGKKEDSSEEGKSFMDWLSDVKVEDTQEEEPTVPAKKKSKESTDSNKTGEKQDPTELLESFIRNRPRISRPKAEFFKPESMAKKSDEDDSEIVSETLAKLMIKQGHYEKAIQIYEKLKLQKPSNLAYFAAQISDIKEKYNLD